MSLRARVKPGYQRTSSSMTWERVLRPMRHRTVHALRVAAERGDADRLGALLDPGVAVVVESGSTENPLIRMVSGTYDAVPVLVHGLATQPGQVVYERPVNGYAGLLLSRNDQHTAAVTVDFAGRLIRSVWIRVSPQG
jgi:hypothetical protein